MSRNDRIEDHGLRALTYYVAYLKFTLFEILELISRQNSSSRWKGQKQNTDTNGISSNPLSKSVLLECNKWQLHLHYFGEALYHTRSPVRHGSKRHKDHVFPRTYQSRGFRQMRSFVCTTCDYHSSGKRFEKKMKFTTHTSDTQYSPAIERQDHPFSAPI